MSSSSPRPTAHRAFTVLLAVLLVGGIVTPIGAAEPAAAQDGDTVKEAGCYSVSSLAGPSGYLINEACQDWAIDETSYDGNPAVTQTTLHGMAVSEWESQQALRTVMNNYAEDTESIASLEARNALATAYEQGNTTTTADDMARSEIRDYYSQRQINTLESFSKSQAQMAHIGNITNEDGVARNLLFPLQRMPDNSFDMKSGYTGDLSNQTYTLANGSTHEFQIAKMEHWNSNQDRWRSFTPDFSNVDPNGDYWETGFTTDGQNTVEINGQTNVRNSYYSTSNDPENGLPQQRVFDMMHTKQTLNEFDTQASEMSSNYQGMAEDLYAEMDAGNLDPNEVRGAESMVRYLSGDSNATTGDYQTALHYVLDTSNPNLTETSTMRVHIDGATDLKWDDSTNDSASREPIPTDPMNDTIEGLLFADGVESVESGVTYQTNATDNKSFYVIGESGTQTTLIEGNLTVEAIYDSDGNEMDNASYSDPRYGTYNASEFVSYLEENEEARAALLSDDSDGSSGGGISISNPFDDLGSGGAIVGLVIIVGAFGVVAAVVVRRP